MNSENFTKWLQTQILPNLPPRSVIVMDNASYHSVQNDKKPTTRTLVKDIKEWLNEHHIPFDNKMRKPELLLITKRSHHEKIYVVD
ncbi:hypothetical protein C0J52_25105 [Blattella germanica]|nr:hypothetical protein C0J52_25105 [Blattella germanica]